MLYRSKYQFADLAVLETTSPSLCKAAVHVLQNSVVRKHQDLPGSIFLDQFLHPVKGTHRPVETSLAALKRSGENVFQNLHIPVPMFFVMRYQLVVLIINQCILPVLFALDVFVLLHKPVHLPKIIVFVALSLLLQAASQVANLRHHL